MSTPDSPKPKSNVEKNTPPTELEQIRMRLLEMIRRNEAARRLKSK
jgi:hypothetical protein